jgi:heme o synthase
VNSTDPAASSIPERLRTWGAAQAGAQLWKSLLVLFKVRVVFLLLGVAVAGACLAARGWPPPGRLALLLVAGGSAAAGASAINQYLERRLDARMQRTRQRPLVTGALASEWVPFLGALMILVPVLAVLPSHPALAVFLLLGAAIYLGVYSLWLKPRSLLNVVVGGAAGSAAVLSGSAVAGVWHDPGALLLALVVFLWTPTHFWSLAIAYRDDYAQGGFPMLPVQSTPRAAAGWILLHTSGAGVAALALAVHPLLGWPYGLVAGLATVGLLVLNLRLLAQPTRPRALVLFHASNLYLATVVLAICAKALV